MNIKPVRIQRSRKTKQESPNGLPIVYVGRPSKWGNPFKVAGRTNVANAVSLYRRNIQANESLFLEVQKELKGKNLSCWCSLDCECHADVLLEIANDELSINSFF